MSESSIHIRIDREDKERFDAVCKQLGLSMSAAFNLFAQAVIRYGELPSALTRQPNEETLEALEEVNSRRGLSGPYRTIEELRRALDA